MSHFLIIESGSTKVDWALVDHVTGEILQAWNSPGLNPYHQQESDIRAEVSTGILPAQAVATDVHHVFFYGAGVTGEAKADALKSALRQSLPNAVVEVCSDLLAAARGLFGTTPGIACILGTGGNSGLYDGQAVIDNVSAGGFILGDEGSGAWLGRQLLSDFLKRLMPEPLRTIFAKKYELTTLAILEHVYRKPFPNRYLGNFSRFLNEQISEPYCHALVRHGFCEFFERNICRYAEATRYSVAAVGSIAFEFQDIFREVAARYGFTVGQIARSPLGGLIRCHHAMLHGRAPAVNAAGLEEKSRVYADMLVTPSDTSSAAPVAKITESASRYDHLERMSTREILEGINREDHGVPEAVRACIPAMEWLVDATVERMRRGGRLFYIGAGTSGRLGVLDASEIPPTYGMPFDRVIGLIAGGDGAIRKAVEGAEDDFAGGFRDLEKYAIGADDVLVGIAASGTTPYVIGGLRDARQRGILTACITCNPAAPVTREAEIPLVAVVGPEFVTGSTRMKSGTAQKLILNMISSAVMIRLGRVQGNKMVDMKIANAKLVDRGTRMVIEATGLDYDEAKRRLLEAGSVREAIARFQG